jgi:hypothetical protein
MENLKDNLKVQFSKNGVVVSKILTNALFE